MVDAAARRGAAEPGSRKGAFCERQSLIMTPIDAERFAQTTGARQRFLSSAVRRRATISSRPDFGSIARISIALPGSATVLKHQCRP